MDNQNAGYVNINGAQIHVAELRQCTADVRRFLEYLPAAQELTKHEKRSPEWFEVIDSVADPSALLATVQELGQIHMALASGMNRELEARA